MFRKFYQRFIKPIFCPSDWGEETKKGFQMNVVEIKPKPKLPDSVFPPTLIDSKLLPLFQKAEEGDIDAILKLSYAFYEGKGTKINDDLAIQYFELLFDTLPNYQYEARYYTQYNMANIEAKRGNYDEVVLRFYNMTKLMYNDFPFEEWKFDDFKWMKGIALSKTDENE